MIITSRHKLEVGKTYTQDDVFGLPFEHLGEFHSIYKFLVIREATDEEYREDCIPDKQLHPDLVFCEYEYFYKISMD